MCRTRAIAPLYTYIYIYKAVYLFMVYTNIYSAMRGRHSSSVVRLVVVYDADSTQSCNEILICLLHFSRSDTDRELSPCPTISIVVSTAMWGCQAVRGDKQPKNTQNRDLDGTRSGCTGRRNLNHGTVCANSQLTTLIKL